MISLMKNLGKWKHLTGAAILKEFSLSILKNRWCGSKSPWFCQNDLKWIDRLKGINKNLWFWGTGHEQCSQFKHEKNAKYQSFLDLMLIVTPDFYQNLLCYIASWYGVRLRWIDVSVTSINWKTNNKKWAQTVEVLLFFIWIHLKLVLLKVLRNRPIVQSKYAAARPM